MILVKNIEDIKVSKEECNSVFYKGSQIKQMKKEKNLT